MNNHTIYDIAFSLEENIHTVDRLKLIKKYETTENIYSLKSVLLSEETGRKVLVKNENIEKAKYLNEFIYKSNIKTVKFNEDEYPKTLNKITDPPFLLFLKGDHSILDQKTISIVGTRKPDNKAITITKDVTKTLSNNGYTIISGLAKGIDSFAHTTTMDNNGKTIGVLGCGIDITYPAASKNIVRRMLDNGSLIISEYPPTIPPYKHHFPIRNRIIAGISEITILIQCPLKSGSSITASLVGDYGRELYVYNPYNNQSETNETDIKNYEGNIRYLDSIPKEYSFNSTEELLSNITNNLSN